MSGIFLSEKLLESAKQAEVHAAGNKRLRINVIEIQPVPNYDPHQIKSIRTRLGLTQGLMGGIVGVSTKTIEAWEIGYRRPSSTAMRVLAELDTNPDYFKKLTKLES